MKRMKRFLQTIEMSCWQKPQFAWAPLIPYLIMGGASILGSTAGGLIAKSGADAQAKMTEKINREQMAQTEKWNKVSQANYEREEVVTNLNNTLKNNVGLRDSLIKIWGGSQRRGVL